MPVTLNKPTISPVSTARLEQRVDTLMKAVKAHTSADGSVDGASLQRSLQSDPTLADAFKMLDQRLYLHRNHALGAVIGQPQVQDLVAVLAHAGGAIRAFDTNGDGSINWGEAHRPRGGDAGSELAKKLIDAATRPTGELKTWLETLKHTEGTIHERKRYESEAINGAGVHCQTEAGEEAVAWFRREKAVNGKPVDSVDFFWKLNDAERGLLSRIPVLNFFGSRWNHLDDGEVQKFLGVADLKAFATEAKARVEAKLGQSYADYLQGKDLPGWDKLDDPDYRAAVPKMGEYPDP